MRTTDAPSATCALSERLDTRAAAAEVAELLREGLRAGPAAGRDARPLRPDALFVFGSFHHRARFSDAIDLLRGELHPAHVLGTTVESAIGGAREVERSAGFSALALIAPGAEFRPFWFTLEDGPPPVWSEALVRDRVALAGDVSDARRVLPHRGIVLVADPFTSHAGHACAAIDAAAGAAGARIHGGIASGASHAGLNVLVADRHVASTGLVGLSIFGDVAVDGIVSQGCRPIGAAAVVTRARAGEILEIGGRPAIEAAQRLLESVGDADRARAAGGLLVGIAPDAAKPRLGRGDFLARPVLAIHPGRGSIEVGDAVRTGATIQFEVRDARTAHEDLELALSVESVRRPAAGALLFSCNARGTRLFAEPDHDAAAVTRALGGAPVAGFQCAGEIAVVGKRSRVHTQSACAVAFRPA